jgi:TonB family protein
MIKTEKRNVPPWKNVMVIIAVAMIFIAVACGERALEDMKKLAKQSTMVTEYPVEVQDAIDKIKANAPNAEVQVIGILKNGEPIEIPDSYATTVVTPKDGNGDYAGYMIIQKGAFANKISEISATNLDSSIEEEVFTLVEEMATPIGGIETFYAALAKEIKYPKQAREDGIEGRVYVEFIVKKDGSLSNFGIVRGIGSGCDEEALRVLSLMPRWNPAKQKGQIVNSRFNLPIVFKLAGMKSDNTKNPNGTMKELVVKGSKKN